MWILFGIAGILFTGLHAHTAFSGKPMAKAMAAGAFSCVALTLLGEYARIAAWVKAEDWTALMDVVPYTFPIFIGYTIVLLIINGLVLISAGKK